MAQLNYQEIAIQLHKTLDVKDRSYHLKTYKQCWLASDAVIYLCQNFPSIRHSTDAEKVMDQIRNAGYISHVVDRKKKFEDGHYFWKWERVPQDPSQQQEQKENGPKKNWWASGDHSSTTSNKEHTEDSEISKSSNSEKTSEKSTTGDDVALQAVNIGEQKLKETKVQLEGPDRQARSHTLTRSCQGPPRIVEKKSPEEILKTIPSDVLEYLSDEHPHSGALPQPNDEQALATSKLHSFSKGDTLHDALVWVSEEARNCQAIISFHSGACLTLQDQVYQDFEE